jgi:two-component system, sensor histidine kinase and response regulator
MLLIYVYHTKRKKLRISLQRNIIHSIYILFILIGVGIVTIDQLITSAITPFMVMYIILSLVFLAPPKRTITFFTLGFLVFYFSLKITQTDPSILASNRVNGLTICGLGIFLSIIMWKHFKERYVRNLLIENQNRTLKIQNNELKAKSDELSTEIDIKNKIFSIIAHDLKTPFNTILGLSDVIKENTQILNEGKIIEYAEAINHSAEQANLLLENLLIWGRMQNGQISIKTTKFNLRAVTTNVAEMYKPYLSQKNIHLNIDIPIDLHIVADIEMFKTILRNITSNAIKFTHNFGTITINTEDNKTGVILRIIDNGIGIEKHRIENLFNSLLNQATKGTNNESGTGLGLSICKDFIGKHRGTINVTSELGKGSSFELYFPHQTA